MNNLSIIVLVAGLSVVASGQTVLSGRGVASGASSLNGQSGLTYHAGTDTCVDGTQSDCVLTGAGQACANGLGLSCLPGIAGHPLAFRNESAVGAAPAANQPYWALPWPVTAPDATNGYSGTTPAAMNTAGTDVDFNAYMVIATGPELSALAGLGAGQTFKTGDGGDMDFFSRDNQLMFANTDGGASLIVYIDTAKFKAHLCSSSNPCVYYTGIRTSTTPGSTTLDSNGADAWSRNPSVPAHTLFELMGDGVTVEVVNVGDGCTGSGCHTLPLCATTYHDCQLTRFYATSSYPNGAIQFTSNTYGLCSATAPAGGQDRVAGQILPTDYVPGWHGTFHLGDDDSIAYSSSGAGLWHPSTVYTAPDSFIVHTISSTKHCGFQATVGGASGTTDPFAGISSCPTWNAGGSGTVRATFTDGTVTWSPISASGGNSGATDIDGQGPGFDIVTYRPGLGCSRVNTRLMTFYRGNGWTGGGASSGPLVTDNLAACYNLHASGADSIPGWTASNTCSTDTLNWMGPWSSSTTYHASTHDSVNPQGTPYEAILDSTNVPPPNATYWKALMPCQCNNVDYATIHDGGQGMNPSFAGFTPTGGEATAMREFGDEAATCLNNGNNVICDNYNWETTTNVMRPCVMGGTGSHCVGHEVAGWQFSYKDKTQVSHNHDVLNYADSTADPGIATIPSNLPGDHHGSARNQTPVHDANPIFLAQTDVPSEGRRNDPGQGVHTGDGEYFGSYNVPWYNEEIAADPSGSGTVWRFAHSYNTGSSIHFDAQNAMGVVSYDGTMYALSTDGMNTRGSLSPDWQANHSQTGGDIINPSSNNTNRSSFQYQTTGYPTPTSGTGTSEPNWNSAQNTGQTVTESSCTGTGCTNITWTNIGHPCDGLRADGQPANSTTYTVGDTVMGITGTRSFDVFQASCPGSGGSCTNGTNFNLNTCPASGPCVDNTGTNRMDGAVLWMDLGPNDCRADIVVIDLTSAHR